MRLAEAAAPSLAVELNAGPVHDVAEIERVVVAVAREQNGGLIRRITGQLIALAPDVLATYGESTAVPVLRLTHTVPVI